MNEAARATLNLAAGRLGLSTRAYFKVLKVAQTIADMADHPVIEPEHVAEALHLRSRLPT